MKKIIVVTGLLHLLALLQSVAAQSSSYPEPTDLVPTLRQKITLVSQNLDQLQSMASDLIGVALRELDNVMTNVSPALRQQYLENIYRYSLALQQIHGRLQRLELQIDSVADAESNPQRIKQVYKQLIDRELLLLEAGPKLLTLLDNPAERIGIYKLIASLT